MLNLLHLVSQGGLPNKKQTQSEAGMMKKARASPSTTNPVWSNGTNALSLSPGQLVNSLTESKATL